MDNFTLSFDVPLVSQQLVMAGGDQDPLEKTFNTADAEQYQHSVCHPDEPVLPNVDFLLGLDETIVPSMSAGKRDKVNSIFSVNCVSGSIERSRK